MTVQIIIEGADATQALAELTNMAYALQVGVEAPGRPQTAGRADANIRAEYGPSQETETPTPADYSSILKKSVPEIKKLLAEGSVAPETLQGLLAEEKAAKRPRSGLIAALEEKIAPQTPTSKPPASKKYAVRSESIGVAIDYDDPAEAARQLIVLVERCADIPALDLLESENALMVGELPDDIRNVVSEAIEARYTSFGVDSVADEADAEETEGSENPQEDPAPAVPANDTSDLTLDAMKEVVTQFVESTSLKDGQDLFKEFGIVKLRDLDPARYPELRDRMQVVLNEKVKVA